MNIDPGRQYRQDELPSDIFNSGNGDIKNFNGQQVHVIVNNNGTRSLQPVSAQETAMQNAKMAQDMQIQANQPAIQTLQTQYNPDTGTGSLVDRYKSLVDSITASEQPAINAQTTATENELGRRGLTADSGVSQNQLAASLAPITTQFGQLQANTGLAEQQDLGQLASQIASLRAGNVGQALQYGQGISGIDAQLQAAQLQAANNIAVAQIGNQRPFALYPGAGVYNPVTGAIQNSSSFTPTAFTPGSSGGQNTSQPATSLQTRVNNPAATLSSPQPISTGPQLKNYVNGAPGNYTPGMGYTMSSNLLPSSIGLR